MSGLIALPLLYKFFIILTVSQLRVFGQEWLNAAVNTTIKSSPPTPVVFWHGMGDTAYGSIDINRIVLQKKFPGIHVMSIQIGKSLIKDELSGYLINVNDQIEEACQQILDDAIIREHGSFNAIGFSQGGQFMRGLIQRCPFEANKIRVKNFISLGGQHQGVYGLPRCPSDNMICNYVRHILKFAAYSDAVQDHIVQAEYWHDPNNNDDYISKSVFLADINNERSINATYRDNLLKLDNMVLVKFEQDDIVVPRETSHFGYYKPGHVEEIVAMEATDLYIQDKIGLKTLNESNRLHLISIPGEHLQYKMKWFIKNIAMVYLNN